MITVEYARRTGRQLTYLIRADHWGRFTVLLHDKEVMRGQDALAADGRHSCPNKRKAFGAVHAAKSEIESLRSMNEI